MKNVDLRQWAFNQEVTYSNDELQRHVAEIVRICSGISKESNPILLHSAMKDVVRASTLAMASTAELVVYSRVTPCLDFDLSK
jgi:hypothetical protein